MKSTLMKAVLGMLLAAIPAGVLAQESTKTVGSFTVDTQQDEISGKVSTVVYSKHLLGADDDTLGMLMVGCRDNAPAITFYGGQFLMGNRMGRMAADDFVIDVQYRFPSEAQGIEQLWLGQPGHKAASPSELFGKGFMSQALKHELVTMRVNDRDGESLTFKFGLVELEQALKHLECYAPQQSYEQ